MEGSAASEIDTSKIRDWRSIVTLIVFVITSKLLNTAILQSMKLTQA